MVKLSLLGALVFAAVSASAQPISATYLQQYNNATDYAPLLAAGLKDPANGGEFYARKVLAECNVVRKHSDAWKKASEAANDAPDSSRAKSIALLVQRCEKITDAQLRDPWVDTPPVLGVDDPLILAERDVLEKISHVSASPREKMRVAGPDKTREPGKRVLVKLPHAIQDPLFISSLTRKWQVKAEGKPPYRLIHTYLRGDFRPGAEEVVGVAAYLAPCEMGLQCDATEFEVALPCADSGLCYPGRVERVRRKYAGNEKDFDNALSTTKELVQSLKEREDARLLVIW